MPAGKYVLRLDREGTRYRLEVAPGVGGARTALVYDGWPGQGDGDCFQLSLWPEGAGLISGCEESATAFKVHDRERLRQLEGFLTAYRRLHLARATVSLRLEGQGSTEAGPAEVRALVAWAEMVSLEAYSGRGGASWALAAAWHQEARDRCGSLQLERYGVAYLTRCGGGELQALDPLHLDEPELEQLYAWLDAHRPFEERSADESSYLVFSDRGPEEAPAEIRDSIRSWLAGLHPDFAP